MWDDSSTDSFDGETSLSSLEHNLEVLKVRLQSGIGKDKEMTLCQDPALRKKSRQDKETRKGEGKEEVQAGIRYDRKDCPKTASEYKAKEKLWFYSRHERDSQATGRAENR
jgi:hypothetical protein